jgi:hypothetical protein
VQWQAFFKQGGTLCPNEAIDKADVSFLPAMQRRRLSTLARAALNVAHQCMDAQSPSPSIFCSLYGETQRTYGIIESVARQEDVSPMAFSLSVHNAISGQFSIFFNNTQPTTAISPSDHSYLSAFSEAVGLLDEGASSVLVVCYEEPLPEFYQPYISSVNQPVAIAFRIRLASADEAAYSLAYQVSAADEGDEPGILALIRCFMLQTHDFQQGQWRLSRA